MWIGVKMKRMKNLAILLIAQTLQCRLYSHTLQRSKRRQAPVVMQTTIHKLLDGVFLSPLTLIINHLLYLILVKPGAASGPFANIGTSHQQHADRVCMWHTASIDYKLPARVHG